jgi:cellulose biosynthesis protein BcsQ
MIVSFYSFKGGVGRSLALAHAAWLLAARSSEQQILAIDLDLEAPGLDGYFPFPGLEACQGLAGLFHAYQQQPEVERKAWLRRMLKDESHGYVVRPQDEGKLTNLWYLPSGLDRGRTVSYRKVTSWLRNDIAAQDRSPGWPTAANRGFLGDLRAVLAEAFAYVLIDSRTGLADEAFASTVLLADALVVCFRLSDVHLQGIRSVVANFAKREGLPVDHPALPLIPVVTPLPTRGGQDIQRWLAEKVLPLFQRWRPPDDDLDTWERSPLLASDSPVIRLYEEPYVEIGQPMLVDEHGEFLPGFDDSVPLVAGYRDLVESIALAAYPRDLAAARELEQHYLDDDKPRLALRYWTLRAAVTLEAFDDLQEFDEEEIGSEAAKRAMQLLESWEERIAAADDDGHDALSNAWSSVADLAEDHAKDLVETSGERAIQAARSPMTRGTACLRSAQRLWLRAFDDASDGPGTRIRQGSADPRARLVELLEAAERELTMADAGDWLLVCFDQQIDLYRIIRRYQRAVDALENASRLLASGRLDGGSALDRQTVIDVCLTLGQICTAVRVGAEQRTWMHSLGLMYLLLLGWRRLAGDIAADTTADIREDQRAFALLAEADASNDESKAQEIVENLPGLAQIYLALVFHIIQGRSDLEMPSVDKLIEKYPSVVPLYSIWARLFDKPQDISDADVLVYIHRSDDSASLVGVWAYLIEKPAQATQMLRRQLRQAVTMDARARALTIYGLHAAFLHNSQIAQRCGQLLSEITACAPEAAVVARNTDPLHLARAVLRQLAERGRIDMERRALMDELWRIIDTPPAPTEPEALAWSWQDGLPIEELRQAARLLERLPEDFDELIAMPLTPAS